MEREKKELLAKEYWADRLAMQIIQEKGDKDFYTIAAGITPSGVVHIGNFREIITGDLVAKALESMGKKVRFIYSWDDHDVFRKVPANIQDPKRFEDFLRMSVDEIPDPFNCHSSYAGHFEKEVETILPLVGIFPEFIYQAKQYKGCVYAEEIRIALKNRQKIKIVLDKWRAEEHDEKWIPFSVYCGKCSRDNTEILSYDEEYTVAYRCLSCNFEESFDFRKKGIGKLPWRVDWPMRWFFEKVDFEPAGKDHSSEGGSRTTANEIVKAVFDYDFPIHLMYEFVYAKGQSSKMSKSVGNTITLKTALEVYEPQIIRYLFVSTIPGRSFNISFDADLINTYEQFDKLERIYFGVEQPSSQSELSVLKRMYELSCVGIPVELPFQPGFRRLTVVLQTNLNDIAKTAMVYSGELKSEADKEKFFLRANCAKNWIENYAPEEFRFVVQEKPLESALNLPEAEKAVLRQIPLILKKSLDVEVVSNNLFELAKSNNIELKEFFRSAYVVLIGKEKGPKLASLLVSIGFEKVEKLLRQL